MHRTSIIALLLALFAATAAPPAGAAAHPHYLRLLRQGAIALEQDDPGAAVRDLELACFGLLEEPPLLGECLGYLAVGQARNDDDEGFRETFRRIVEVEERFGGYSDADLPAGLRAELEERIAGRIAPRTLRYSAVFAHLAREPEPTAGADGAAAVAAPAPPGSDRPEPPPAPEGLDRDDRERLDRARALLAEAVTRTDLEEPYRLAREVAGEHPDSRRAQHLAAVIAYRSARWDDAVRHFRRGGALAADDARGWFYFAVSLYETGEREEATRALRRSLPGLEETPFVRTYREKILGQPSARPAGPAGDGPPG